MQKPLFKPFCRCHIRPFLLKVHILLIFLLMLCFKKVITLEKQTSSSSNSSPTSVFNIEKPSDPNSVPLWENTKTSYINQLSSSQDLQGILMNLGDNLDRSNAGIDRMTVFDKNINENQKYFENFESYKDLIDATLIQAQLSSDPRYLNALKAYQSTIDLNFSKALAFVKLNYQNIYGNIPSSYWCTANFSADIKNTVDILHSQLDVSPCDNIKSNKDSLSFYELINKSVDLKPLASFPGTLKNLDLSHVILSKNASSVIPLMNLPLESLSLNNTGVESVWPLRFLKSLLDLQLRGNPLKSFVFLKELTLLTSLWIPQTGFKDFSKISSYSKSISSLDVSKNPLSSTPGLSALSQLRYLNISETSISNLTIPPSLEFLKASKTLLKDGAFIANNVNFQEIDISYTSVSTLPSLNNFFNLTSLNYNNSPLQGSPCPALETGSCL